MAMTEMDTLDALYFNIDGATFFNMLDGMTFEDAQAAAIAEYKEMSAERTGKGNG